MTSLPHRLVARAGPLKQFEPRLDARSALATKVPAPLPGGAILAARVFED